MLTFKTFNKSFLSIVIIFILIGCSNSNKGGKSRSENSSTLQEQASVDPNVIKVYVSQYGKIKADGNEISLTDLDSSFSKLKRVNGIVYYSRDNRLGDPPQESMQVMELIVKYSLPVKLFTDETFDVIVKPY